MSKQPRVVRILDGTSVDGPGLRTSIYFAGCAHHCLECHNPATWDFMAGREMSVDRIMARIVENEQPVTFSGGDPMYQAAQILPLARMIKARGINLWCYTGFTFEELVNGNDEAVKEILTLCDVLVDGPFEIDKRDISLLFRGSRNQRLIDVRETIKHNEITLFTPFV